MWKNVDEKGLESLIFRQKKRHSITLFRENFPPLESHSVASVTETSMSDSFP